MAMFIADYCADLAAPPVDEDRSGARSKLTRTVCLVHPVPILLSTLQLSRCPWRTCCSPFLLLRQYRILLGVCQGLSYSDFLAAGNLVCPAPSVSEDTSTPDRRGQKVLITPSGLSVSGEEENHRSQRSHLSVAMRTEGSITLYKRGMLISFRQL